MDHVAIMTKKWGLIPKILSGGKTIESRWYKTKRAPWDKIAKGDTIYFKNTGEPVTANAKVKKVLQISNLTRVNIREIYSKYGKRIGVLPEDFKSAITDKAPKNYCVLIFLTNPKPVKPFNINKVGFGVGAAWITTKNIKVIKSIPTD